MELENITKDPFYERKFVCFKAYHAEQCLTNTELCILGMLLDKIEEYYPNRHYLCVNQDEPYAEKVWELIKEGQKCKNVNVTQRLRLI